MPYSADDEHALSSTVSPDARACRHGHQGGVLWFTGLSGSGKSTLAIGLEQALFAEGFQVFVLDGDNLRHGLNRDLGFSYRDRQENIRRVIEMAVAFADAGTVVITAFISPFRADRERARQTLGKKFHEIFVDARLEVCEARDPKGLYKKARAGIITEFTGISSPYERPESPALSLDTGGTSINDCVAGLRDYSVRAFRRA